MTEPLQTPLRVASVGTSAIMRVMQEAIRLTRGVEAVAVYSRDRTRARAFADEMGIAVACDDYEAMLRRPDVDAVYIASPNALHARQAIRAMEHGKHVIVEKPAATTVGEIKRMLAAARLHRVFFFEAITTLFMPNYIALKDALARLGPVRAASVRYGKYSSQYDAYLRGDDPNIFSPAMQGGALNDMGVYCVHVAVDLFGPPLSVRYAAERGPNGVDLAGTLTLTYPTFVCLIETAKDRNIDSGCRIEAERGFVVQSGPVNAFAACEARENSAIIPIPPQPEGNRMRYELARFRDAIARGDMDFFNAMALQSLIVSEVLENAGALKA